MERMTLREAAERTAFSVTTLRRYIRSGRLRAEKRTGRYGPEYFVSEQALAEAGLDGRGEDPPPAPERPHALARPHRESLPLSLYQELQMKHEQLLVQYGMVRAGGLRAVELQADLEARRGEIERCREELSLLKERFARETAALRQRIREADLELEGRAMEIAALREKLRAFEMLARNAVTSETIESQFAAVRKQMRVVGDLSGAGPREPHSPASRPAPHRGGDPEH